MSRRPRVFLCDGDRAGWAVDEDRRLTAQSLEGVADLVGDPIEAEIIHACWWAPLMELPVEVTRGRHVVCHLTGEPARCLGEAAFAGAMRRVTHWVAQSRHALDQMRSLTPAVSHVPYSVDAEAFANPAGEPGEKVSAALKGVPAGAYVIANFHRDAAGAGLKEGLPAPKLVKGPDLFVDILGELRRRGANVVALLAGPRRHWMRRELGAREIPHVFAGEVIERDDYPANTLPRDQVALLYKAANLVVSCGRSEGGPRSVLEAAAAGIAQIATPVGLAPDVLSPDCVFRDAVAAVELVLEDIRSGILRRQVDRQRATVLADHTPAAVRERFRSLYDALLAGKAPATRRATGVPRKPGSPRRVCFWNKFTPPPWGGGNQFMLALKAEAERQGYETCINGEGLARGVEVAGHVVNSVQFDIERFRGLVEPGSVRVVHRIDGPISVLRATPESLDQDRACFDFNARYACATVIQSWHTVRALSELGFAPVRPMLVHNASDPTIFRPAPQRRAPGERLKVVATCWSPSPGKGAAIYEWMGWNLPRERFELTFVGNCPTKLPNWNVVPPLPSDRLADLLRSQDVFATASRNDPCSNALIEAMSCGLPVLYLESGGHPELASFGGLGFRLPGEIPGLLARLREHHATYRALLTPAKMADVCRRYMDLIFGDAAYRE